MSTLTPIGLQAFFASLSASQFNLIKGGMAKDLRESLMGGDVGALLRQPREYCLSDRGRSVGHLWMDSQSTFLKTCEQDEQLKEQLLKASQKPFSLLFKEENREGLIGTNSLVALLRSLSNALITDAWPWLAVRISMQEEVNLLVPPLVRLIRTLYGHQTRVFVLTTTQESWKGLQRETIINALDPVACYTLGQIPDISPIDHRTIVLFDNADLTQTVMARDPIKRLRLGRDNGKGIIPLGGPSRLIAFSKSSVALPGYHLIEGKLLYPLKEKKRFKNAIK